MAGGAISIVLLGAMVLQAAAPNPVAADGLSTTIQATTAAQPRVPASGPGLPTTSVPVAPITESTKPAGTTAPGPADVVPVIAITQDKPPEGTTRAIDETRSAIATATVPTFGATTDSTALIESLTARARAIVDQPMAAGIPLIDTIDDDVAGVTSGVVSTINLLDGDRGAASPTADGAEVLPGSLGGDVTPGAPHTGGEVPVDTGGAPAIPAAERLIGAVNMAELGGAPASINVLLGGHLGHAYAPEAPAAALVAIRASAAAPVDARGQLRSAPIPAAGSQLATSPSAYPSKGVAGFASQSFAIAILLSAIALAAAFLALVVTQPRSFVRYPPAFPTVIPPR